MSTESVLPQGLASLPPGPQLAVALASVDPSMCASLDLLTLVELQAKQTSYDNARMLRTLLETAYAVQGEFLTRPKTGAKPKPTPETRTGSGSDADAGGGHAVGADGGVDGVVGPPRRRVLTEFSSDQLGFALVWPAAKVHSYLLLAQDIIERLPAVFAALAAGRIDLPRAEAFSDALWGLSDDKARTIVDELLVKAEQWVPAILRERLRYKVLKADPSLARERYRHTVADRRAYLQPYSDGTAELGATNLPPDKASAAFNRVDRMARAAKHAGDLRNLGQLRADVILDLLSGRPFVSSPSLDNITAQADQANRDLGNDQTNDLRDDPNYQPDVKRRRGKLEPRKRSRATTDTDKTGDGGTAGGETDKAAGGDADRAGSGKPGNCEADKTGNGKADQAGNGKADQAGNGEADPYRGTAGTRGANPSRRADNGNGGSPKAPDANANANGVTNDGDTDNLPARTAAEGDSQPAQAGRAPNPDGAELSDPDHHGRYLAADYEPIGVGTFEPDPPPDPDTPPHPYPDRGLHPGPDPDPSPDPDFDHDPYLDHEPDSDPEPKPDPGQGQGTGSDHSPSSGPARDRSDEAEPVLVASDDPRMCVCGGLQPAFRRGVVDIQVQLTTLIGLNDNPGLIPGWGPVNAEIARQVAYDEETNPVWKFSVTDTKGKLLHHGPIRRRPTATEQAFVNARDITCRAPGCRKPARNCDKDHRQEWANNGPSHRGNIENACRHHHRLRHEHDYHVYRLPDGTYLWQAPNGLIYPVPPHTTLRLTVEGNDGEEIPCEHTKTATGEPWPNLIQDTLPGLRTPST